MMLRYSRRFISIQCVLPGTNRNEIELQFPESDAVEAGTDQLGE